MWTTCILWTHCGRPRCCFGALALAGQPAFWPNPLLWRFPHQWPLGTDSSTLHKNVSCSWELTRRGFWEMFGWCHGNQETSASIQICGAAGSPTSLWSEWNRAREFPSFVSAYFWNTGQGFVLSFWDSQTWSELSQRHCVKTSCCVVSTTWNWFLTKTQTH